MIWTVWAWATCGPVGMAELVTVDRPAVFVLGVRDGVPSDLRRAARVIRRLRGAGPVTVALQVVPVEQQAALDAYQRGDVPTGSLPDALAWDAAQPSFTTWLPVFEGAGLGDTLNAVGHPLTRAPDGIDVPRAPGHSAVLADAMQEHWMPPAYETRFAAHVAWLERRVARDALASWSGEGALVVLASRLHVEGGKGLTFQLGTQTERPVHGVLLGGPGRFYEGDRYF